MGKCELTAPKGNYIGAGHEDLPPPRCQVNTACTPGSRNGPVFSMLTSLSKVNKESVITHFERALPRKTVNNIPCY